MRITLREELFYLLAVEALVGKLLFMAGGAVDVITFSQEALRADGLPAFKALEAVLVPHLVLVLHTLGSYKHKYIHRKSTIETHTQKCVNRIR